MKRKLHAITKFFGNYNAVGFSLGRKASVWLLLAEGWGLLALEADLLAELGWVLALGHRILAVGGGLLAVRDYLDIPMLRALLKDPPNWWVLGSE